MPWASKSMNPRTSCESAAALSAAAFGGAACTDIDARGGKVFVHQHLKQVHSNDTAPQQRFFVLASESMLIESGCERSVNGGCSLHHHLSRTRWDRVAIDEF